MVLMKTDNYFAEGISTILELLLEFNVDLIKAFDTINHDLLLEGLNSIGICGVAEKLLVTYLRDFEQWWEQAVQ